jgi:hypothetical protein
MTTGRRPSQAVCILLILLVSGVLAGGIGRARAQTASVGSVENAVGVLVVRRADGRVDELRGKGSLPLYEGDECHTEKASKALIKLSDGTQVAMNAETKFR